MFVAILLDAALSIAGGYVLIFALRTKDSGKKFTLFALTVLTAALIFAVNYKFIYDKYWWWIVSLVFVSGIIQFMHYKPKPDSGGRAGSYRGD